MTREQLIEVLKGVNENDLDPERIAQGLDLIYESSWPKAFTQARLGMEGGFAMILFAALTALSANVEHDAFMELVRRAVDAAVAFAKRKGEEIEQAQVKGASN